MPRKHREQPIDSFLQALMTAARCETLYDAHKFTGMSNQLLKKYADNGTRNLPTMLMLARRFKLPSIVVLDWINENIDDPTLIDQAS